MEDEITPAVDTDEAAASEPTEVEEGAEPSPETPAADAAEVPEKKENRVQKRIDEITREKHEERQAKERAEREAEYWRKVATGEIKPQPQPSPTLPNPDDFIPPGYRPEPVLDQFETWDDFNRSMLKWEAGRIIATRDYEEQQKKVKAEKQSITEKHKERMALAQVKYPDFEEVIATAPEIVFIHSTFDAIAQSDFSADLQYHFSANPKEAERINGLNPVAQIKEIAKLETKFESAAPAPVRRVTQAPSPISPVNQGDAGIVDMDKLEGEAWAKAERERVKKLGRRY